MYSSIESPKSTLRYRQQMSDSSRGLRDGDRVAFKVIVEGKHEAYVGFYNATQDEFVVPGDGKEPPRFIQRQAAFRWEHQEEPT